MNAPTAFDLFWIALYLLLGLALIVALAPAQYYPRIRQHRILLLTIVIAGMLCSVLLDWRSSPTTLIDNAWNALYLFLILGSILTAILRRVIDRDYYVSVISSLALIFLPSICHGYLAADKNILGSQVDIVMNVQATFVSCGNVIVMFIVTFWLLAYHARSGRKFDKSWGVLSYEFALFIVALVTMLWAAHNYEGFVVPQNYSSPQKLITWVRPATVDCPMNWARIVIAALLLPALFIVPWNRNRNPVSQESV